MTELKQIYKCEICGNIVEVLHKGQGELVCCNEPMKLQSENTIDASNEKHIPIIEGNKIKVGSVEHPMNKDHYIEWVEASDGKQTSKIFLKPNQAPKAEFSFAPTSARAYCNLHGLWKSQ